MKMSKDVSGNYSDRARELIFESARDMHKSLEDFLSEKSGCSMEDVELFNVVRGYAIERLSKDLKIMVLTGNVYDAKHCLNEIASLVEAEY